MSAVYLIRSSYAYQPFSFRIERQNSSILNYKEIKLVIFGYFWFQKGTFSPNGKIYIECQIIPTNFLGEHEIKARRVDCMF